MSFFKKIFGFFKQEKVETPKVAETKVTETTVIEPTATKPVVKESNVPDLSLKELVQKRRSTYVLGKNTDLTQDHIVNHIKEVVKETPSAFNSQTSRVVVLFDESNKKFWNKIADIQRGILGEEGWQMMGGIIEGAPNGLGTVLFFEDKDAVAANIPSSPERVEVYKQHNSANTQYATWLSLAELGLGGSLQHFNVGYAEGYDADIRELFGLPDSYELIAQIPFGSIEQEYDAKDYIDEDEQVQVFNKPVVDHGLNFTELVKNRRSTYALGKNTDLTQEKIVNRIQEVVKDAPSAFNSQTSRVVVLFDKSNEKFWNEVAKVQKKVLGEEGWQMMGGIIEGAPNGLGTVLFFEDTDAVAANIPSSPERVEVYKQHNSANAQYATWLALSELGLGGSLQHFNVGYAEGYDADIRELFGLPDSYELIAQIPFGSIEQEYQAKEYLDSDNQVKVFNK